MGVKSQKKAKTRLDAYYRLAKDQGYRARSAFKLIQLNRKYDFLSKARVLVDLCAAPGGWCQVAAKYMPIGSKIVGVDLVPIVPIRGCKTFVGDITDDKTRKMIVTWLKKEPVDCVIHDGAPNVGGVWARDLFDQNALVLCATKMATTLLRPGGWFVTKVFRSQDFQKLIWVFKQLFDKVEATKPLASRMESAEIFVVCAGYKAPKHIDPKMFNAQAVFSDVGQEKVLSAAGTFVMPRTNVPMGYDEFSTIAHRVGTMSDFIACNDPKEFLKSHHEIRFPEEDKHYLQSKHSRKELVYLCHDLQQVGDADKKRLMRWRDQLIREQTRILQAEQDNVEEQEEDEESEEDEGPVDPNDDVRRMALELLEIQKRKDKEEKKKAKRVVDRKLRQVRGLMNHDPLGNAREAHEIGGFATQTGGDYDEDGEGVGHTEYAMSALNNISEAEVANYFDKHHEDAETAVIAPLEPIISVNVDDDEDFDMGKDGEDQTDNEEEDDGDYTHVGKSLRVIEGQEEQYDVDAYGNYIYAEKSNRVSIFDSNKDLEDDEDAADDGLTPEERKKNARKERDEEKLNEAGQQSKWQRRQLNIDQVLNRTFPKPRDPNSVRRQKKEEDVIEMSAAASDKTAMLLGANRTSGKKRTRFDDDAADDDNDDSSDGTASISDISDDYFNDGEENDYDINEGRIDTRRKKAIVQDLGKLTTMELIKQQRKQIMKDNKAKSKGKKGKKENKENKGFEEIPIAMTDPEVRARTLAIATKMLDGKTRREILDNSVNKYMHNDDEDLPDWFIKDEQRNCKVILPVTAAEMEAERARFREMNARPSKKVMEAMGRKRRKAQRMLRGMIEKGKSDPRARDKANSLSVRTLMRSKAVKGEAADKKKKQPMDSKKFGELRRAKKQAQRNKKR